MKNNTIGKSLLLGFGIAISFIVAIGTLGVFELGVSGAALRQITGNNHNKVALTNAIKLKATLALIEATNVVLADTPADLGRTSEALAASIKDISATYEKIKATGLDDTEAAALDAASADRKRYRASFDKAISLAKDGDRPGALHLISSDTRPLLAVYSEKLEKIIAYQEGQAAATTQNALSGNDFSRIVVLLSALCASALAVLTAYAIQRAITIPIRLAMEMTKAIATGDLSHNIAFDPDSRNEAVLLLSSLNAMTEKLRLIVGEINDATDTISVASREIAGGSMDLSGRTEAQASALEETSSSMEQLTSSVRQNATTAKQAGALATQATTIAGNGGAVFREVIVTMSQIDASAKKIVDIIAVIDGIAFQTNILALNAAVEAARAGEQGRGFAVVASEVRNLAQRSAQAAKEVKLLIEESVSNVTLGSRLVGEAGSTMDGIVSSIDNLAVLVNAISSANAEQSAGISHIGGAISQMDDATQRNAALVEETAAAAQSLEEQGGRLRGAVATFTLGRTQPARALAPRLAVARTGR